ncbi:ribosomal protein S8 [Culex quinquefasciatus]|uniref:Ribosomal protein S8 n=1 Tax=Culex quinquefasciatus TaxID=7176 RepID=B0X0W0_CULQU|nr:ribosomal protein S8 [Culex quinquefasciatus]|eukprot:XP_001863282.1 ribosomal protein S8 [Culex quinquefasciatus]
MEVGLVEGAITTSLIKTSLPLETSPELPVQHTQKEEIEQTIDVLDISLPRMRGAVCHLCREQTGAKQRKLEELGVIRRGAPARDVIIDSAPFRQWYESHYLQPLGKKHDLKAS